MSTAVYPVRGAGGRIRRLSERHIHLRVSSSGGGLGNATDAANFLQSDRNINVLEAHFASD
jgi:hypothetical protein